MRSYTGNCRRKERKRRKRNSKMDERLVEIAKGMAKRVKFLTEKWERDWYAAALVRAMEWGKEQTEVNEECSRKNRLKEKYPRYLPE